MFVSNNVKNIGLAVGGLALNTYGFHQAAKANDKWNDYLKKLPKDDLEKLRARDWYLMKHSSFFGSGCLPAERYAFDMYKGKSEAEKEQILTQYRWSQVRQSDLSR